MSCAVAHVNTPQERANLTMRRIKDTKRQIWRVERAKELVCGVISDESQRDIRKSFEEILPLIQDGLTWMRSGALDELSDEQLKRVLSQLQECHKKLGWIIEGSVSIGLEAIEPFPKLLAQLRIDHDAIGSQIEGLMLSLNETFQGAVKGSAEEIHVHA